MAATAVGKNTGDSPDYTVDNANYYVGLSQDSSNSGVVGSTTISRMTTQKWIIKY